MNGDSHAESVKDAIGPRMEEISRRQHVADTTQHDSVSTFKRVQGTVDPPFHDDRHKYVMFSVSSKNMFPRCFDPSQPALMVIGVYESVQEVHESVRMLQEANVPFNIQVDEMHKWIVAANDPVRLKDIDMMRQVRDDIIANDTESRLRSSAEFRENVTKQKAGSVPIVSEEKGDHVTETGDLTPAVCFRTPLPLRDQSQRYVAMLCLPDHRAVEYPEFVFCVLYVSETLDDMDRYVRNVASLEVLEYNIHVIETNAWIFPQMLQTQSPTNEVYRNSELNEVMSNHRNCSGEAQAFEKEQGLRYNKKETQSLHASSLDGEHSALEESLRGAVSE